MEIYGLVGLKLGHSFSRAFFTEKFKEENIDADYLNFEMPSVDDPEKGVKAIIARYPELKGLNVTIPYKKDVLALLDYIDPVAEEIGAVNTLKIERSDAGSVKIGGYNTDIIGFSESIKPLLPTRGEKAALILGTGGASRAVKVGLEKMGYATVYASRTPKAGGLIYDDLAREPGLIDRFSVIVNASPLGMWPDVDSAPAIPYDRLGSDKLCYDLVYNPDPTKFMQLSAEHGAATCSGIKMLIGQALASWEIWQR